MKLSQFKNTTYSYFIDLYKDNPNADKLKKDNPPIERREHNPKTIPEGYGSFFSVNGFESGTRRKEFLTDVNCIHIDIDNTEKTSDDILKEMGAYLFPTIMNKTKNGFHCFWLLEESIPVTDENRDEMIKKVEGMNKKLVELFGGDNAATDVTRVLRIPGTLHCKDAENPFTIKTIHEKENYVYTLEELLAEFPPIIKEEVEIVSGTMTADVDEVFQNMMQRNKIAKLYNGDIGDYNDDKSGADLALCSHLAFWFQKDRDVMRDIWLGSPLGSREKTQTRLTNYVEPTLDKAIAGCTDVYTPKKERVEQAIENKSIIERDDYLKYIETPNWDDAKWVKGLIRMKTNYALAFHNYFKMIYPHLLFEKGQDMSYWNYNKKLGIYEELSLVSVKELVINLLIKENLDDKATGHFAKDVLERYRSVNTKKGISYDDFDNDDTWFHASNGWVHLETLKFIEHTPEKFSRRCSSAAYDKEATCPLYDNFLDNLLELKKDQIRYIDQFSGLILTNDINNHDMMVLIGKSGCGKSTLIQEWMHILGDMATPKKLAEVTGDSARFGGSSLTGKTLCWFDEVDVKKAELDNSVGLLISNKTIRVERKGVNGIVESQNKLKCILTANQLPRNAEIGMYRRMTKIMITRKPFDDVGELDINMDEKLEKESSGVLNRMIRGLHYLKKMDRLIKPDGQEEEMEEYKEESSDIAEFLATFFIPASKKDRLKTSVLYECFDTFKKGHTYGISSPAKMGSALNAQPLKAFSDIKKCKVDGKRGWCGLKLNPIYKFDKDFHGRKKIIEKEASEIPVTYSTDSNDF